MTDLSVTRDRPRLLSLEAWVMSAPSRAFRSLAAEQRSAGAWLALRRPLFVAFVLGSVVSILTAGAFSARVVVPATVYWSFVPLAEVLALVVVTWRRTGHGPFARVVDVFFTGHGPWTLYVIALAVSLTTIPIELAWGFLTSWCLLAMAAVIGWSAYIDFHFFVHVIGAGRRRALFDVVWHRLLTWTVVFFIFAVPGLNPSGLLDEVVEVVAELRR